MKNHTTTNRKDEVAKAVLAAIIAKLEKGVNPWVKPWTAKGQATANADYFAVNLFTKEPYTGINQAILEPGYYATFKQIKEHQGTINKGAKGCVAVWNAKTEIKPTDEEQQQAAEALKDPEGKGKSARGNYVFAHYLAKQVYKTECRLYENGEIYIVIKTLKKYVIFRYEDTQGLTSYLPKEEKHEEKPFNANSRGEKWISKYLENSGLAGLYYDGGDSAYYMPMLDEIHLPKKPFFHSPEEFYSTAFHEMTHSTGNEKRLNRRGCVPAQMGGFGSQVYSYEELIAEIGAAMAMGFLGIKTEGTEANSAAYLKSWAAKLQDGTIKANIGAAAAEAKKAFCLIASYYEKKEEKKQENKKPMLPAVIIPAIIAKPAATLRAYKAKANEEPKGDKYEQLSLFRAFPEEGKAADVSDAKEAEKVEQRRFSLCYHYGDNNTEEDMFIFKGADQAEANAYAKHAQKLMGSEDYLEGDFYFAKPIGIDTYSLDDFALFTLNKLSTPELVDRYNRNNSETPVMLRKTFLADAVKGNVDPEIIQQVKDDCEDYPYIRYSDIHEQFFGMDGQEARKFLIDNLLEEEKEEISSNEPRNLDPDTFDKTSTADLIEMWHDDLAMGQVVDYIDTLESFKGIVPDAIENAYKQVCLKAIKKAEARNLGYILTCEGEDPEAMSEKALRAWLRGKMVRGYSVDD